MAVTDDVREDVLEQLNAVMFAFRGEMRRAMHEAGHCLHGMEVRMFLQIAAHPGCTASELVARSGRDKGQMARLIQQLEQSGLVQRQPDPADRRVQRLSLTEGGLQLHGQLQRQRQVVGERLLAKLSAQEQGQLAALLARIAV